MSNRPPRRANMLGQKHGRLEVIGPSEIRGRQRIYWGCRCECGQEIFVRAENLKNGKTKSCGCLHDEIRKKGANLRHGMSHEGARHPIYSQWAAMIQRVCNKNNTSYLRYGGRGIKIYEPWKKFENFYNDMGQSWHSGLSIERIDNDGHYEPMNCRWATTAEQNRNKITSRFIQTEYGVMNISDAADMAGIHRETLRGRIKRGVIGEALLTAPHEGE
jgi:hypothetical protein